MARGETLDWPYEKIKWVSTCRGMDNPRKERMWWPTYCVLRKDKVSICKGMDNQRKEAKDVVAKTYKLIPTAPARILSKKMVVGGSF